MIQSIQNNQQYQSNFNHNQNDDYQLHHANMNKFNDLPVQQSESDEEDILQKIDNLLAQQQQQNIEQSTQQVSKKQMLLNLKITQLQKICQNLSQANRNLNNKLQEFYNSDKQTSKFNKNRNNDSNSNILNADSESMIPYSDELTQIQGQFGEIETLLKEYKQQLQQSEKKWALTKQQKQEEIQSLKKQIISMTDNKQILQNEMKLRQQQIQMLKIKNQQLLIELQEFQIQLEKRTQTQAVSERYYEPSMAYDRYSSKRYSQYSDYHFSQKIQKQLQSMIKKLLKQLSHQRKINSKMSFQIKRLSTEVIQLQRKIKHKNDGIYQLQMKILHLQKYQHSQGRMGSPSHYQKILSPGKDKKFNSGYDGQYRSTSPHRIDNFKNYESIEDQPVIYEQGFNTFAINPTHKQAKINKPLPASNGSSIKGGIVSKPVKNEGQQFIKSKKKLENRKQSFDLQSKSQFLSFTLIQLQQGTFQISMKQKILVISRLIDLYCRKIKNKDYYNLIAQQILVYNMSPKHPSLLRIKTVEQPKQLTQEQDSQQSLLWNMAFIVENVIREVSTSDRQDLEVDLNLGEIIEEILSKPFQEKLAYFEELSKSLEASVA